MSPIPATCLLHLDRFAAGTPRDEIDFMDGFESMRVGFDPVERGKR